METQLELTFKMPIISNKLKMLEEKWERHRGSAKAYMIQKSQNIRDVIMLRASEQPFLVPSFSTW